MRRPIVSAAFAFLVACASPAAAQPLSPEALASVEGGLQGHFGLLALCGAPTGPTEAKVSAALLGAGAAASEVEALLARVRAYAEAEARKVEGQPDTFGMKAQVCSPQGLADMDGLLDLTLENLAILQAVHDYQGQLEASGALPPPDATEQAALEPSDDDLEPYAGERLSAEWMADFGLEMGGGAAALDACGLDSDDMLDDFERSLRAEGAGRGEVAAFREAFEAEREAALEELELEPAERAFLEQAVCNQPGAPAQLDLMLRSSFATILAE